jgi:hypothetical protein
MDADQSVAASRVPRVCVASNFLKLEEATCTWHILRVMNEHFEPAFLYSDSVL